MDINRIDAILIELITLFDEKILVKLLIVNKDLNFYITKYFYKIIEHKSILDLDGIEEDEDKYKMNLEKLYYLYIKDIAIINTNLKIRIGMCGDCGRYEVLNHGSVTCLYGCMIKCCNKNVIVPTVYDDNAKLSCGCKLTYHHRSSIKLLGGGELKISLCNCGELSTENNRKCTKCGRIPFRNCDDLISDFIFYCIHMITSLIVLFMFEHYRIF